MCYIEHKTFTSDIMEARTIIKTTKLAYLLIEMFYVNNPILYSLSRFYMFLEFVDVPYTLLIYNWKKATSIFIHHMFVLISYHCLLSTPEILNYHLYTFLLFHVIKNIPYDHKYLKWSHPVFWSPQIFVPLYYYMNHLDIVILRWNLLFNLQYMIAMICCMFATLAYAYGKKMYDIGILISFKLQDEYHMTKLF